MSLQGLIRWEWVIMFGIALGLGLWELRAIRRALREDRAARQRRADR